MPRSYVVDVDLPRGRLRLMVHMRWDGWSWSCEELESHTGEHDQAGREPSLEQAQAAAEQAAADPRWREP